MLCVHGFQLLEDLLCCGDTVRHGSWLLGASGSVAAAWLRAAREGSSARIRVVAPRGELRRRRSRAGCWFDGMNGLRWCAHGSCGTSENELLRDSIGSRAYEEIVEAESREQIGQDLTGPAWAVDAENAVIAGGSLDLHAGLSGDSLENLEECGVLGVNE